MARYIALLRGINVGGKNKIRMNELVATLEKIKFKNLTTLIQSGNIVFETAKLDPGKLSGKIVAAVERDFGYDVGAVVRTENEFRKLAARHPFEARSTDLKQLHVTFLSQMPKPEQVNLLKKSAKDLPDQFRLAGRDIYVFCPGFYSDTKLTNGFFEKSLKMFATTRNWRTTTKLLKLLDD